LLAFGVAIGAQDAKKTRRRELTLWSTHTVAVVEGRVAQTSAVDAHCIGVGAVSFVVAWPEQRHFERTVGAGRRGVR
jgi:hypothetical protein